MSLPIGKIVPNSNYYVEKLLGEGAYGEVYLATHIHLNIPRALKVLIGSLNSKGIAEFKKEAQRVASLSLSHQDIVQVVEFFFLPSNEPVMVLEFMEGGSLEDIVELQLGKPLELSKVIEYVKPIGRALQYAHNVGIIHRDVKPANCLLTSATNGKVKLGDFGIAVDANRSTSMRTAGAVGTITYMAPEQIQSAPTIHSDQYGLAIMVYELVNGSPPFLGTLPEVYKKQLLVPPPLLNLQALNISDSTEIVLQKALSKDPEARFSRIEAFVNALEHSQSKPTIPTISGVPQKTIQPILNIPPLNYGVKTIAWIDQMPLGYQKYIKALAQPSSPLHPVFFKQLRPLLLEAFRSKDFNDVWQFVFSQKPAITIEDMLRNPRDLRGIVPIEWAILRAIESDLFFAGNATNHNKVITNLCAIYLNTQSDEIIPLGYDGDNFLNKFEKSLSQAMQVEYMPFLRLLEEEAYRQSQVNPKQLPQERQYYYTTVEKDTTTRIVFFDRMHGLLRIGITAKNWEPVYLHVQKTGNEITFPQSIYNLPRTAGITEMDIVLLRCFNSRNMFSSGYQDVVYRHLQTFCNTNLIQLLDIFDSRLLEQNLRKQYRGFPDFVEEVIAPLLYKS